jgi:hypothetical protein
MVLEPVFEFLQRRHKYQTYEQEEWETNQYLQLYRLAQESLGHGEWRQCNQAVPITGDSKVLGNLDIESLAHPIITKCTQEAEKAKLPTAVYQQLDLDITTKETLAIDEISVKVKPVDENDTLSRARPNDKSRTTSKACELGRDDNISVDKAQHILEACEPTTNLKS